MASTLTIVLLVCAASAIVLYAMGFWSTLRHRRMKAPALADGAYPPVTMLKPIKGTEEALEDNLRTFFEQDYPAPVQIVFASTELDDAGMDVARRVAAAYPHVPVRFVISDPSFGLNPKVANLAGALELAMHDVVLQSDANVRIRPDYLRRAVAELVSADASLLSSIVVGVGERSIGAAMENLQLSAFIGPGACTALHVAGIHCVVGKSMLFRKSHLDAIGGLEIVRDILAEDFILGERFKAQGKKVLLSTTTVENVNERIPIERFLSRHSRWLKMRAVIHLGGFFADIASNPIALVSGALLASGFDERVAWLLAVVVVVKMTCDSILMRITRGVALRPVHWPVAPLKDALMGAVWLYSIFSRSVTWRGTKLRFGAQSRLRPDDGILPIRLARRLLR